MLSLKLICKRCGRRLNGLLHTACQGEETRPSWIFTRRNTRWRSSWRGRRKCHSFTRRLRRDALIMRKLISSIHLEEGFHLAMSMCCPFYRPFPAGHHNRIGFIPKCDLDVSCINDDELLWHSNAFLLALWCTSGPGGDEFMANDKKLRVFLRPWRAKKVLWRRFIEIVSKAAKLFCKTESNEIGQTCNK